MKHEREFRYRNKHITPRALRLCSASSVHISRQQDGAGAGRTPEQGPMKERCSPKLESTVELTRLRQEGAAREYPERNKGAGKEEQLHTNIKEEAQDEDDINQGKNMFVQKRERGRGILINKNWLLLLCSTKIRISGIYVHSTKIHSCYIIVPILGCMVRSPTNSFQSNVSQRGTLKIV